MGLPDEQTNPFREKAHKIAEKYSFQGKWNKVEEFILLPKLAPGEILSWYLSDHSVEDWFGFLPIITKIIRSGRPYPLYPKESKRIVKYPQRKRGYNDKGTLPRYDKLPREYYAREDKERTEIIPHSEQSFYPSWYTEVNLARGPIEEHRTSLDTKNMNWSEPNDKRTKERKEARKLVERATKTISLPYKEPRKNRTRGRGTTTKDQEDPTSSDSSEIKKR